MVGLRSEYLISRNNAIASLIEIRKKPVGPRNGGKKRTKEALTVTERHCATTSRTFRIPPLVVCLVVKRISGHICDETRVILHAVTNTEHAKTVTAIIIRSNMRLFEELLGNTMNVVCGPPSQSRSIDKMRSRYVYSYSSTL